MSTSPSHHLRVVCAAIVEGDRYLITQRAATSTFPLLWEFPGGRVKGGQTDQQALADALDARLGIKVDIRDSLGVTEHPFSSHKVSLVLVRCCIVHGEPRAKRVRAFAWVCSKDFGRYEFVPTDQSALNLLMPSST